VSPSALLVALAIARLAQEGLAPSLPGDPAPPPARYAGVVPGPDARNPLPRAAAAPPRLVWTGFKMVGERSEIFLQTSGPVTYDVGPRGAGAKGHHGPALSVFLRNCRIHLKNNGRRLDTRYFSTPVAGVVIRQRRKDVELSIALKEPATPSPRVEPGPDGTQFIVLEFPPGRAPAPQVDERP
jgi:hypothetical protein